MGIQATGGAHSSDTIRYHNHKNPTYPIARQHYTRVVQQVPGLVLYFIQQQTHKNYNNVISQHTFPAVQYNLPSDQQVARSLQHRNHYHYYVEISGHAASLHHQCSQT